MSDGTTVESETVSQSLVVKHPALTLDITADEVDYVTLGESVSYTVSLSHSSLSTVDAHSLLLIVELSVPGQVSSGEQGLNITHLTGKKLQVRYIIISSLTATHPKMTFNKT